MKCKSLTHVPVPVLVLVCSQHFSCGCQSHHFPSPTFMKIAMKKNSAEFNLPVTASSTSFRFAGAGRDLVDQLEEVRGVGPCVIILCIICIILHSGREVCLLSVSSVIIISVRKIEQDLLGKLLVPAMHQFPVNSQSPPNGRCDRIRSSRDGRMLLFYCSITACMAGIFFFVRFDSSWRSASGFRLSSLRIALGSLASILTGYQFSWVFCGSEWGALRHAVQGFPSYKFSYLKWQPWWPCHLAH